MIKLNVENIRQSFKNKLKNNEFVSVNRESSMMSLVGNKTIEIVGASFIADEDFIFGKPNLDWIKREEQWYNSQSLNVNDIPPPIPEVWKMVADKDGFINSNYGWCIYSAENVYDTTFWNIIKDSKIIIKDSKIIKKSSIVSATDNGRSLCQYNLALEELLKNPESRRAIMIYTRPNMWLDYNKNGRSDFCCTNAVQYMIRDGKVDAIVQMRSNDSVMGYKGDFAWQKHVLEKLVEDLNKESNNYEIGDIHWNAGSLHVYSGHFYLVDPENYNKEGKI